MRYNVAQLLKEPIGSTRVYQLQDDAPESRRFVDRVAGEAHLMRTHQGILVTATVDVDVALTCSRCVSVFTLPLTILIEEEFFPLIDVQTGRRVALPEGVLDPLCIDTSHTLDLTEALRQYVITELPLKPLCRPGCLGLCHTCGANLNLQQCDCRRTPNPRGSTLGTLLEQRRR